MCSTFWLDATAEPSSTDDVDGIAGVAHTVHPTRPDPPRSTTRSIVGTTSWVGTGGVVSF